MPPTGTIGANVIKFHSLYIFTTAGTGDDGTLAIFLLTRHLKVGWFIFGFICCFLVCFEETPQRISSLSSQKKKKKERKPITLKIARTLIFFF